MKLHYGMWGMLCVLLLNVFPAQAQLGYAATTKRFTAMQTDKKITIQAKREKLASVLESIQKQTKYSFVYSNDEIDVSQRISINIKDKAMEEAMEIRPDAPCRARPLCGPTELD